MKIKLQLDDVFTRGVEATIEDKCPNCGAFLIGKNTLVEIRFQAEAQRLGVTEDGDLDDYLNVDGCDGQHVIEYRCGACNHQLAASKEGYIPDVSKKDLEDAPLFTVFKGSVAGPVLEDEAWDFFTIGGSSAPADVEVRREANKRGIALAHDIDGDLVAIMKDDELAPEEASDDDAALAYIASGGMLAKLPDTLDSKYCRFYPVLAYKPPKEKTDGKG